MSVNTQLRERLLSAVNHSPAFNAIDPNVKFKTLDSIQNASANELERMWTFYFSHDVVKESWAMALAQVSPTPITDSNPDTLKGRTPRGPLEDLVHILTPERRTPDGRIIKSTTETIAGSIDSGLENFKFPDPIELPDPTKILLLGVAGLMSVAFILNKM